ncbi:hypothetical protein PUNSTDRAFT_51365 [Punctularia strigosozonata HHB-11173 SS5]|uniref:uncharacterized protein n=1 Tax=Punctularia strigosozonata (strain HHB-11173) TaxID=741275 RepID=UPI00044163A2|nr:uncharacterized protein PUNSTDRAFT_51365 [Punctularia strigosozonata HHB-11173 SS5]EIN10794.1 hypothetical protein PUNSTDRAFT_51365 [Punctularia strigosozonata HHB-11173 SS5]
MAYGPASPRDALVARRQRSVKAARFANAPYHRPKFSGKVGLHSVHTHAKIDPRSIPRSDDSPASKVRWTTNGWWSPVDHSHDLHISPYPPISPCNELHPATNGRSPRRARSIPPLPIGAGRPSQHHPSRDFARLRPFSEWIVDYVCAQTRSGLLPFGFSHDPTNDMACAVDRIYLVLLAMPMELSCVIYAIYYTLTILHITSLLPPADAYPFWEALYRGEPLTLEERIVKMVTVGMVLADKWLNCCTYRMSEWSMNTRISREALIALERAALNILNYELSVTDDAYSRWLGHLIHFHVESSHLADTPHRIVGSILGEVISASRNGLLSRPDEVALPAPSEWNPSADPILPKEHIRTRRSSAYPVTSRHLPVYGRCPIIPQIAASRRIEGTSEDLRLWPTSYVYPASSYPIASPTYRATKDEDIRMLMDNYPTAVRSALSRTRRRSGERIPTAPIPHLAAALWRGGYLIGA